MYPLKIRFITFSVKIKVFSKVVKVCSKIKAVLRFLRLRGNSGI